MPKAPKAYYIAQSANSEDRTESTYVAEEVESVEDDSPTVEDFLDVLRRRGSL